jgi:hypothetical protein
VAVRAAKPRIGKHFLAICRITSMGKREAPVIVQRVIANLCGCLDNAGAPERMNQTIGNLHFSRGLP